MPKIPCRPSPEPLPRSLHSTHPAAVCVTAQTPSNPNPSLFDSRVCRIFGTWENTAIQEREGATTFLSQAQIPKQDTPSFTLCHPFSILFAQRCHDARQIQRNGHNTAPTLQERSGAAGGTPDSAANNREAGKFLLKFLPGAVFAALAWPLSGVRCHRTRPAVPADVGVTYATLRRSKVAPEHAGVASAASQRCD